MADLSVINAALTRTGNPTISRLDDGSAGAAVASANYESLVKAELSNHPWKRASKVAVLNRLDPDVEGETPEPWAAAYQLPEDLVEIRTLRVSGTTIAYEVHGDTLLTDSAEADEVVLHYIWRVPEAKWPPWFREGITRRLEAMFLRGLGERYREAEARDEAAEEQLAKARGRDSQSQTTRAPVLSPTLEARIGGLMTRARLPFR